MTGTLITGGSALVIFFIMLWRMLAQRGEIARLKAEAKEWERANKELAQQLVDARQPAADHATGVRVLQLVTGKTGDPKLSSTDT